jgi:hypothetical protein
MTVRPMSATEFAEAVITHWPPFRWEEHQEVSWTQAIVRELSGFDRQVLGNAMASMVRTRRDSKTPTVAACIDACAAAKRWVDAEKQAEALPIHASSKKSPSEMQWEERKRLADDMVMGPDGKEAARNGWIGALHNFIVVNGRMPKAGEVAQCKTVAREFDQAYAQCVKGGWAQAYSLESLGAAMLANRKHLAETVLHGVVK